MSAKVVNLTALHIGRFACSVIRAVARTLIGGGGVYSYIRVMLD